MAGGAEEAEGVPLNGRIVRALYSSQTIWDWEQQLSRWAPCFTANKSHRAYTAFLAEQLSAAGIEPRRQDFPIPLWDHKVSRLSLDDGSVRTVTGYRPYSPAGPDRRASAPNWSMSERPPASTGRRPPAPSL